MHNIKYLTIVFLLILITNILLSQSIVINEVMSSNSSTITDEDGDAPDWIELYNNSESEINVNGYGISDDASKLFKWTFPNVNIEPHDFLLIFASDKNRVEFKNTIITRGDIWKYKIWASQPPYNWNSTNYNDSQWQQGATGIGYGDDDDNTIIPQGTIAVYARKTFTISNLDDISGAILTIDYDDGFVAYINGNEVARSNVPGNPPAYNQVAYPDHEASLYQNLQPEYYQIDNIDNILIEGENILSIQVHNVDSNSSDFSFIPFLTLTTLSQPDNSYISDELLFNETSFHTNFKIKSSGETLYLTNSSGTIVDQLETGVIPTDISFGRKPDGSENWLYYNIPTPGAMNSTPGFAKFSPLPVFSKDGGFYNASIQISLTLETDDSPIYYTRDCSEPSINSTKYTTPFYITKTSVIRAKSISSNTMPGKTVTKTFFINESHDLPVISLSTDPPNLWSPDSGIYVLGNDYVDQIPYWGANFWEDWERPVHVELYEPDGNMGFDIDAGMKIFGGWSRATNQKSVAIFARNKYGYSEIPYQLFPDRNIYTFQSFVLRNSANDFPYTMFRDGFMQSLIKDSNIDDQAYRPAVIYLNGEYWGIQNIREKLNEHYVASHHNVDPDNIDLLESNGHPNHGDSDAWFKLVDFVSTNNLQVSENYDYVTSQIDISNFIEYNVAQIFFDNTDWPGNNIKYWREKTENGKWRWILFDTDFGFGLYDGFNLPSNQRYKHNTLKFATATNGPGWPNPPWSTLFLRKLLTNEEFKNNFINCFCDNLNSRFLYSKINEKINEAKQIIENEIPNHIEKWREIGSISNWNYNISVLKTFGQLRKGYCQIHLKDYFSLQGLASVKLNIYPENSGTIKINTIEIDNPAWSGHYFKGIPINIEAIPKSGYKFINWTGEIESTDKLLKNIILHGNFNITSNFVLVDTTKQDIVINEINYKSSPNFDTGDWIELYNNSDYAVSLSKWIITDSNNNNPYTFPTNFQLNSNDYIVLLRKKSDFNNLVSNIDNTLGNFDFGLSSNGETIKLYNNFGTLIDTVQYGTNTPWPTECNGTGSTLILKNPNLDNNLPQNWTFSQGNGSPGIANFPIDIEEDNNNIPDKFILQQNYPNPFNNSTIIPFSLPETGKINLLIYNIQGELIDQTKETQYIPGHYSIHYLSNSKMSSGIYFYQLIVDNKPIKMKKMIYIK